VRRHLLAVEGRHRLTVIPERFKARINTHLLGNLADVPDYPVPMWIIGEPGTGKTWQLLKHLSLMRFEIFSVSSADLESGTSSEVADHLKKVYYRSQQQASKWCAFRNDNRRHRHGYW
jgi:hypothetical protein